MKEPVYITTAIDYLNGEPHLGHAYEKLVTDVLARSLRSRGKRVFFLTGLDEHGQKVQQAAEKEGKSPQEYCDELAVLWKDFARQLNLSNNDFIRTTEERHKIVVQAILAKLHAHGHLYKSQYTGFYSTKEETFLTERDRRADGSFDPTYGDVIELAEDNYYFKLQEHQAWLTDYIDSNPHFIYPESRRNEVLGFLKNTVLEDLCISRPASRLNWGIPLPFDSDFVTYVWFDALINYVSVPAAWGDSTIESTLKLEIDHVQPLQTLWPAHAHVIGKDILKFHAVYWPILLRAIGLELPRQLIVHGWWQKDGQKMSKSTGNVVNPIQVIEDWGLDAFRYYVIRELAIGPDGNWTDEGFASRYHAELANGLGNLVNRSLSMLKRYRSGVVPSRSDELSAEVSAIVQIIAGHLEERELQPALLAIWGLINRANRYVDQTAPFKLAKDALQQNRLEEILYNLGEICRILAVLLWPFIPFTSEKIYKQLGFTSTPDKFSESSWGGLLPGHLIGEVTQLFPRRETHEN
jgi:methionyl-tRNA synthetase